MATCDECDEPATCHYELNGEMLNRCPEHCPVCLMSPGRTEILERKVAALCDAIQWIANRGPDKVPSELMEKMKEWGT